MPTACDLAASSVGCGAAGFAPGQPDVMGRARAGRCPGSRPALRRPGARRLVRPVVVDQAVAAAESLVLLSCMWRETAPSALSVVDGDPCRRERTHRRPPEFRRSPVPGHHARAARFAPPSMAGCSVFGRACGSVPGSDAIEGVAALVVVEAGAGISGLALNCAWLTPAGARARNRLASAAARRRVVGVVSASSGTGRRH